MQLWNIGHRDLIHPSPSPPFSSLLSPPLPSFPLLSTPLSLSSLPSLQVLEDRVAQAVQEHLAYQGSQDRKESTETPGTQVHNGDNPALKTLIEERILQLLQYNRQTKGNPL